MSIAEKVRATPEIARFQFRAETQQVAPSEHLLHALAACLTSALANIAAANGVRITEVRSAVSGDIDADAPVGTTAACTLSPAQCTLSTLAAGATVTVTVRTRIIATSGELRNVASATIANDANPANNTDDAVVVVGGGGGVDGGTTPSGSPEGCGCRTSGWRPSRRGAPSSAPGGTGSPFPTACTSWPAA